MLIGPGASVMTSWLWNLLNVGVALVGYHAAAFTIDWKCWGRVRMQVRSDAVHAEQGFSVTPLLKVNPKGEPYT